jgi:hypothetical protein
VSTDQAPERSEMLATADGDVVLTPGPPEGGQPIVEGDRELRGRRVAWWNPKDSRARNGHHVTDLKITGSPRRGRDLPEGTMGRHSSDRLYVPVTTEEDWWRFVLEGRTPVLLWIRADRAWLID